MSAWKLHFSMVATLAAIFGLTTLVFSAVMLYVGYFSIITVGILVVIVNVAQWLLSPYLVGAIYKVRELKEGDNPKLHQMVTELSIKSKIKKPQLMLAQIPLPNAFAYGSPLTGNRVAITQGLLSNLEEGEVEAVLGHELGHLKHRDVQVMMAVSFLPSLFYYIGYTMMLSGIFGGNRKNQGGGNNALIGIGFMVFSWVLTLFTLYLSRLREYYADRHSASIVENGAEKLSMGLVTITETSRRNTSRSNKEQTKNNSAYKALFIADPDQNNADAEKFHTSKATNKKDRLRETLARQPTSGDRFLEVFSTHPNIIKRLRALQELSQTPSA
ncbi:zinc metalloprotease HtpX [Candidatus Bathycorpusculum sp.]|uniref:zinc metalloprotease HtpX n=1 Tax=Candidatus Bathycorpusculum sp. TaxID=2994959 RepID=UPI0028378BC1|nr:zinc metalloprotease HtpX [Candidatus Termitimicrobium sp.]MCL2685036.1 zinc metalloprotease HtpX [Candidatus Termitimicrobium sp.]